MKELIDKEHTLSLEERIDLLKMLSRNESSFVDTSKFKFMKTMIRLMIKKIHKNHC